MKITPLGLVSVVGVPGFEPGSHAPKARMLPLHYTPFYQKILT